MDWNYDIGAVVDSEAELNNETAEKLGDKTVMAVTIRKGKILMDEFHELRETLAIFADTLQETAQDEGELLDTLIELNEQLGERIFITALANGKLAGWYIHKDAPLYYAESREAFDLAKAITAYNN